jgi:chromosome segregation ATPase
MLRSMIAIAALAGLWTSVVFAQATGGRPDVLTELLGEVRELRLVLQRQGADSARIQLLISRLTIQETRVSRLARDLDSVREQLSRVTMEQRQASERVKEMDGAISQAADSSERLSIEQQEKMLNQALLELRRQEQRLRAQESELESAFGAEQARWVEISNRLDELERSLGRP